MSAIVGKKNPRETPLRSFQMEVVCGLVGRDFCSSELPHSCFMLLHVQCRGCGGIVRRWGLIFFGLSGFKWATSRRECRSRVWWSAASVVLVQDRPGTGVFPSQRIHTGERCGQPPYSRRSWNQKQKRQSCPWPTFYFRKAILTRVTSWLHAVRSACICKDKRCRKDSEK